MGESTLPSVDGGGGVGGGVRMGIAYFNSDSACVLRVCVGVPGIIILCTVDRSCFLKARWV